MNLIIAILSVAVVALFVLLIIKLVFWILAKFHLEFSPDVVSIVYAIAGLIILIWILCIVIGSATVPVFIQPHQKVIP